MRRRVRAHDLIAFSILAVVVLVVGTGLGVAAARVRASDHRRPGPLRMIFRDGENVPSLQRDRVRFGNRTP